MRQIKKPDTCQAFGVPEVGLEPTRPEGHWILSPARLPIPPLRLICNIYLKIFVLLSTLKIFLFLQPLLYFQRPQRK